MQEKHIPGSERFEASLARKAEPVPNQSSLAAALVNAIEPGEPRKEVKPEPAPPAPAGGNKVESDEAFTARYADRSILPRTSNAAGKQAGRSEVVDKGNRFETRTDSELAAASMVTTAAARGWDEIKVSGSETFKREAWLEAAARGMHVAGYTPNEQDKADLARRVPEKRIDKENQTMSVRENDQRAASFASEAKDVAVKKHPELAGAYAAVAAVDKKASADGFNEQQRAVIEARVRENISGSIGNGKVPEVSIKEASQQHAQQERTR